MTASEPPAPRLQDDGLPAVEEVPAGSVLMSCPGCGGEMVVQPGGGVAHRDGAQECPSPDVEAVCAALVARLAVGLAAAFEVSYQVAAARAGSLIRDEVQRIGAGKPTAVDEVDQLRAELAAATEQVKRARNLHAGVCSGACGLDDACECEDRDLVCQECNDRWPCPTRRDLNETEVSW